MNEQQFDQRLVDQFFKYDYHDRGMMKWQGFYLSDHTVAIAKQEKQTKHVVKVKPQQTVIEIKKNLVRAFEKQQSVIIQLNELDQELRPLEIQTTIKQLDDEIVELDLGSEISIDAIRNVSQFNVV
ncbi:hypothetical protein R4B61_00830 [Fructilactobacillus vespulae]|uniref:hypothetical protein n=1 Tax=Fructilactobacillus vespulae TaxID=1249630 RepID=UPI0039B4BE52